MDAGGGLVGFALFGAAAGLGARGGAVVQDQLERAHLLVGGGYGLTRAFGFGLHRRDALFAYQQARDLINIGAYVAGSNPQIDRALRMQPHILRFLRQPPDSPTELLESIARLRAIANEEVISEA